MASGEVPYPPIAQLFPFQFTELTPGKVEVTAHPGIQHYNAIGCVHGGYLATLLDTAMACAIQTRLPAGKGFTTLEIKTNFIRPVFSDTGALKIRANLIHIGRTTATSEGKIYNSLEKVMAFGTTTCALFPLKP